MIDIKYAEYKKGICKFTHKEIITKDDYRMALGKNNYKAACSLPMETITDMYIEHINTIAAKNAGME